VSELTIALIAVASAAAAATSSVLQHRSAGKTPHAARHRQISHLLTRPAWLAGLVAGGAGLVLHAVALSGGGLALVQPLLISGILFALPLSALLERRRPPIVEWLWAALLVAGVATFLLAAHPTSGWVTVDADVLAWTSVGCAGIVCITALVGLRWLRRRRALVLGIAAGIGYGMTAALLKQTIVVARPGVVPALTDWPLYVFLLFGAASIALTQLAYRSGPLSRSLPALTFLDPASSIVIGAAAFHELLADSPSAVALQVVGLVLTVAAGVQLARHNNGARPAVA
jgi:drug/metabolite transporter (DMT)-like permease